MTRPTRFGLRCPGCSGTRTTPQQTVPNVDHSVLYRTRECQDCGRIFGSYEATQPLLSTNRAIKRAEDLIRSLQHERLKR